MSTNRLSILSPCNAADRSRHLSSRKRGRKENDGLLRGITVVDGGQQVRRVQGLRSLNIQTHHGRHYPESIVGYRHGLTRRNARQSALIDITYPHSGKSLPTAKLDGPT